MKEFKIIKAKPSDVEELMLLEKKCFKHKVDRFPKRNLLHLINSVTSQTLIIKDKQGKVLAEVIGLLRHFKIPSARIYKIGVDPSLQKKGVGSLLIGAIEKWFLKNKMKKSCAEVRASNIASLTMFERNGYTRTKVIEKYYVGGEDAVKFWKNLSK